VKWSHAAVFAAAVLVTGCYYDWAVRATGYEFTWNRSDLGGYYNLLARGFTEGHLYLPLEPDARLLALPNPLDPYAPGDIPKLFDAVLYNRRYYLYHGAGPAIMLFLPWLSYTGHDLPESFALFLFCLGGYLFAALTLVTMLRMADVSPPAWILGIMLLALGFCQSIPFLLSRVWVYEVAIGGGYFCVAAGLFFFARSQLSARPFWPAASGLMFGMAVACRPNLIVAAAIALVAVILSLRRRAVPFIAALLLVAAMVADYNYRRFGSIFEFGLNYQITGPGQGQLHPRLANVLPGFYYMLLARPEFTKIFPWVLLPFPARDFPRPSQYFIEPIAGALFLAPFLPLAYLALFVRKFRVVSWVTVMSASGILLFLATTGLSTQRYEVDFLPWFVLASMLGIAVWLQRASGVRLRLLQALFTVAVMFGVVVNLAMGVTGPYDDMMKNKPDRYVAIARWLSPVANLRPQWNPPLSQDFTASVSGGPKDLLFVGRKPVRYELVLDYVNGKPVLVSRFSGETVIKEIEPSANPVRFHVSYSPETHEMAVSANGVELLRQRIQNIITAPAQIVRIRE